MKKTLTFVILLLLTLTVRAQLPIGMPVPYPPSLNGTMMPIQFPAMTPAIPDSLTPVMVNHIGRHGARYLTSENKTARLRRAVVNAREAGRITDAGQQLLFLLDRIDRASAGKWGMLDSLGRTEEEEIARRLNMMLPGFFENGNIMAISSYVPRCMESMYSFCLELGRLNPGLQISASSGPDYDSVLRFFDTDREYGKYLKEGSWRKIYDGYLSATVPVAPAERILGTGTALADAQLKEVTMNLYGVLQALPAMGINTSVSQWFTPEEYRACWLADNLRHALQRAGNEAARAARPLLREIIRSIDAELTDEQARSLIRGVFRFGHAETLMPLLALMRMPGCTVPAKTEPSVLADSWNDSFVAPLGANLQIILLSSPSGTIYTATLLNCRPCVPMPDADSYIVEWETLRRYWEHSL